MFKIKHPFYSQDDGGNLGWFEELNEFEETPADDDQPIEESDAEAETDEQNEDDEIASEESTESEEEGSEEPEHLNDDTEIEISEGQAVKLSELKQGYLRQSDYTRKTQALADERKAFEAERESIAPVKGLADFLDGNPYLREQIQYFIKEFTSTGVVPIDEALQDAQYGQYINSLMAKNQSLTKQLQDIQGKYGELEFNGSFKELESALKADYGDLATEEYLTSLKERAKTDKLSTSVLREIADGHLGKLQLEQTKQEKKTATKEAETKTYQKLREKRETLPAQPKKTGQVPSKSSNRVSSDPMGWEDVFS